MMEDFQIQNYFRVQYVRENTRCTLHATRYTLPATRYPLRAGFTLLELIIVLFLLSLILGISSVFFANILPSSRFDATVREVSATIRYARALAKISGERKTITIDLDSRKYGIEGYGERGISSGIGIKVKDPLSGEISTGKYQLVFNAAGDIEGGTIVLQGKKRTVDIEIDPVVGAVVVK